MDVIYDIKSSAIDHQNPIQTAQLNLFRKDFSDKHNFLKSSVYHPITQVFQTRGEQNAQKLETTLVYQVTN